jgi:hypothetical protein
MWFRIMLPGLLIGFLELIFWVVLAIHPGATFSADVASGLLGLGILAVVDIGVGLFVGVRVRFRWRGWRADEAQREEAAQRLADRVLAPLKEKLTEVPPKTKPR